MHTTLRKLFLFGFIAPVEVLMAGVFNLGSDKPVDGVLHPLGYTGQLGQLTITVCLDPNSPFAAQASAPLRSAIQTWNELTAEEANRVTGSSEIPPGSPDLESVALHELGHCSMGLGHTNLGASLDPIQQLFFYHATKSFRGPNGVFDFDQIGGDGSWGTGDDLRGDDINKNFFRISTNDPFALPLPPQTDSSTYSVIVGNLPGGDTFSANGSFIVANTLGYPGAGAVMFDRYDDQVEARILGADDEATVRYGMSGLDELEDTFDEYTVLLEFLDDTGVCDIPIMFGALDVATAQCDFDDDVIGSNHYRVTGPSLTFRDSEPWWFGVFPDLFVGKSDDVAFAEPGGTVLYTLFYGNAGTADASGVVLQEVVPDNTTFNAAASNPAWSCSDVTAGSSCSLTAGSIAQGGSDSALFAVDVDDPFPPSVIEISNTATIEDDEANGVDFDPSNNSSTDTTTIVVRLIFADGFESGDTSAWDATFP